METMEIKQSARLAVFIKLWQKVFPAINEKRFKEKFNCKKKVFSKKKKR